VETDHDRPRNPERDVWHEGVTVRSWQLRNFKSVPDDDVPLHPLSVLVGANSAGKSTLLQSILAVSQAAVGRGRTFPLNGGIVRLGTVEQTRYAGPGAEGGPVSIGAHFELGPGGSNELLGVRRSRLIRAKMRDRIGVAWRVDLNDSPTLQGGQAYVCGIDFTVSNLVGLEAGAPQVLAQLAATSNRPPKVDEGESSRPRSTGPQFDGRLVMDGVTRTVTDVITRAGLPFRTQVEAELAALLFHGWQESFLQLAVRRSARTPRVRNRPEDLQSQLDQLVEQAVKDIEAAQREHGEEIEQGELPPGVAVHMTLVQKYGEQGPGAETTLDLIRHPELEPRVLSRLAVPGTARTWTDMTEVEPPVQRILDFLRTQVQYLGPLREDPRVVYQDSPEAQNGYVGSKGEFCAAVLQNSGNRRIHVPLPGQALGRPSFATLSSAVNAWAGFLEIGDSFRASDRGRLGLELQVRQRDVSMALDLTSVGTGVSQLLPVLVLCLQAPRGSLLMIEQPELHLNPAVQQRLADFLLAVAASGRQLIVETHSEYLVSRLRLRIAQDSSDLVHKTVGFLFTERTNGRTKYRPVDTNEYGSLENWPANFFDQAAQEAQAILRAAVDKRRAALEADGVEAARAERDGAST
jgi:predicted ATPase